MTRLQERIINRLQTGLSDLIIDHINGTTFFRLVMSFYIVLNAANVGKSSTVMIVGKFNENWMAAFFAMILRSCRIFIFPDKKDMSTIPYYCNRHHIDFIFADEKHTDYLRNYSTFRKLPFVKCLFDMERHKCSITRTSIANPLVSVQGVIDMPEGIDITIAFDVIKNYIKGPSNADIYTLTAGRTSGSSSVVVNDHETIMHALTNSSEILSFNQGEKVELELHNVDKFFVTTILNPFLSEARILSSLRFQDEIIIFDTKAFEEIFEMNVVRMFPFGLWERIINKLDISWLVRNALSRHLKMLFGHYRRVIILNAELPMDVMKLIKRMGNFTTTFGSTETNHLICYNDYSTKELRKDSSIGTNIGRTFPTVEVHETESLNKIVCGHLFKGYVGHGDPERILREDMIESYDVMKVRSVKGIPHVYYRGHFSLQRDGVWYDRLEKEVKGFRFVKNAIFSDLHTDNMTLLIEPDVHAADLHGVGYLGLERNFSDLLGELNKKFGKLIADKVIILSNGDFIPNTYDGRNVYWMYRDF